MYYWVYFLILARFFGAFYIFPLFNDSIMPKIVKVIISAAFAVIIYPYYMKNNLNVSFTFGCLLLVKEALIGILLGYLFSFPIWLIENLVNIIDLQRGEQFGAIVNQLTKNPSSSISKLLNQAFVAYFVTLGGIYVLVNFIMASFLYWPLTQFVFDLNHLHYVTHAFTQYFYWVAILSLPVVLVMFILEVVLGLMSSFVQQINVTVLSMPVKSLLALIMLIFLSDSIFNFVIRKFLGTGLFYVFKI